MTYSKDEANGKDIKDNDPLLTSSRMVHQCKYHCMRKKKPCAYHIYWCLVIKIKTGHLVKPRKTVVRESFDINNVSPTVT